MMKHPISTALIALAVFTSCGTPENSGKRDDASDREKQRAFDITALDRSTDPCENFYDFAVGGFIENHPIPESESRWGRFDMLVESNNLKIREILNEFAYRDDLEKGSDQQLTGHLFRSGMDSAAVNERGLRDVQPLFDRIEEIDSYEEYYETAAYLTLIGVSNPFSVYVSPDKKNVDKNFLYLSQSGLSLPGRDYYLKEGDDYEGIRTEFKTYAADMLELAGSDPAAAGETAQNIYAVELTLAENQMSNVDRRDPAKTYNKKEIQSFLSETPNIMWERYFGALQIATDSLIVSQPEYMKFLSDYMTKVDLKDLKTYMKWHVLNEKADFLPEEFEKRKFDFYGTVIQGTKEMKPRWKRVMNRMGGLKEQLGHLYVEKHFAVESKDRVEQMVEDIRAAYRERIKQLDWMTDETKAEALEKLDAFSYKIGYPDKWSDYSDLNIETEGYFNNMAALSRYKTRENLDKLDKPVDRDEWSMGAHTVNAYYKSSFNEIVFPAGILQPPFFNPDADDAVNYGGIGGVIGHEFTHGFDDKGSLYGADGNLKNWWTDEDSRRFDRLVKRIIEQYNAYEPLEGLNVNGEFTVGENIADLGGITLAYYAYKKSREGKPEPEPIDGFTDLQRVFLGWAQVWQTNATAEFIRNRVMTNSHAPARYRVNGPLSNMVEFQEAFNCEPGEGFLADEEERTEIW